MQVFVHNCGRFYGFVRNFNVNKPIIDSRRRSDMMINKTELAFYADPKKDGIIENSEIDKATATVSGLLESARASANAGLTGNIYALSQKLTEKKTSGGSLKYFTGCDYNGRAGADKDVCPAGNLSVMDLETLVEADGAQDGNRDDGIVSAQDLFRTRLTSENKRTPDMSTLRTNIIDRGAYKVIALDLPFAQAPAGITPYGNPEYYLTGDLQPLVYFDADLPPSNSMEYRDLLQKVSISEVQETPGSVQISYYNKRDGQKMDPFDAALTMRDAVVYREMDIFQKTMDDQLARRATSIYQDLPIQRAAFKGPLAVWLESHPDYSLIRFDSERSLVEVFDKRDGQLKRFLTDYRFETFMSCDYIPHINLNPRASLNTSVKTDGKTMALMKQYGVGLTTSGFLISPSWKESGSDGFINLIGGDTLNKSVELSMESADSNECRLKISWVDVFNQPGSIVIDLRTGR